MGGPAVVGLALCLGLLFASQTAAQNPQTQNFNSNQNQEGRPTGSPNSGGIPSGAVPNGNLASPPGQDDINIATLPNIFTSSLPHPTGPIQPVTFSAPFFGSQYVYEQSGRTASIAILATATPSIPTSFIRGHSTSSFSIAIITSEAASASPTTTSSSTLSSSSTGSVTAANASGDRAQPSQQQPLSGPSIAGIVVGSILAALALIAALLFFLLRKRSHHAVPQSPDVYPEEAYLYDPPMRQLPRAVMPQYAPYNNTTAAAPQNSESALLLGGAAMAGGLGAVSHRRSHESRSGATSPHITPGYSDDQGDLSAARPLRDPFEDEHNQVPSDFDELERSLLDPDDTNHSGRGMGSRKPTLLRMTGADVVHARPKGTPDSMRPTPGSLFVTNPDAAGSAFSLGRSGLR